MKCGVVVFPGSNCDHDVYHVLKHVLEQEVIFLWHEDTTLKGCDLVVLPGGLSYGDYLRGGAMAALSPVMDAVREHAERGGLVLGICNGFQVLTEAHLLPGALRRNRACASSAATSTCASSATTCRSPAATGRARCCACRSRTAKGNYEHFEAELDRLEAQPPGGLPLRRAGRRARRRWNLNGSARAIAGLINERGNVLGLMPHPERCAEEMLGNRDGLAPVRVGRARAAGGWRGRAMSVGARPSAGRRRPTGALAREHGLSEEEWERLLGFLGRTPTLTELGITSALWSEHCSYKSSKVYLREFPTTGPRVLQGPGENAGVVDIGHGWVAVFKMESPQPPELHRALPGRGDRRRRHPARRLHHGRAADRLPRLAALRRARRARACARWSTASCAASATTATASASRPSAARPRFHPSYNGNILVNAFALGVARRERIFKAKASGVGNPILYVGSRTGRDGIHGATMASESFDAESEKKKPTVQVGDPFTEKILLEACLEAMRSTRDRRDPGHGRRRADQLDVRDGGARRRRHPPRPRPRAAARAGAVGLRDDALGVAGAHGDRRRSAAARRRSRRSSASGGSRSRRSAR